MATTITSVDADNISHALFIDLQIGGNVFHFSNAYKPITVSNVTYSELGSFLTVDDFQEDLKTTEADLQISLSGIPSDEDYLALFLAEKVKGGNVQIQRGFFDTSDMTIDAANTFVRYKGIITNFAISDNADRLLNRETATITVSCSNIQSVLKNLINGQRTNPTERDRLFPGHPRDKVFDKIPDLYNTSFDFGKEYDPFNSTGGGGYGGGGTGGGGGGGGRDRNRNREYR